MSLLAAATTDTPLPVDRVRTGTTPPPEADDQVPMLHHVPRRSPFGALLTRTLPAYSGAYHVGVCDMEVPVPAQTIGSFRHKSMPGATAGLYMDTVLFSLFYPCEPPKSPEPVVWFPKLGQTIDGFLRMAKRTPNWFLRALTYPLAAAAIYGTTFPANKNARFLEPAVDQTHPGGTKRGKWPLLVFSHGVGCSRLMYSAFCGEMASRGYVVAALEHRDGTSPSSTIVTEDGKSQVLDWIEWSDLEWPELEVQPTDDTTLRHDQIRFRVAEITYTIDAVARIARGDPIASRSPIAPDFDWSRWHGNIECEHPVMAGHSLGGSAALEISAQNVIPFSHILAFDPATQRLEPWADDLPHPLLLVNSEEFIRGKEWPIFTGSMAERCKASLEAYSIGGATHPSFSDVFLILPELVNKMTGLTADAEGIITLVVRVSEAFLLGRRSIPSKLSVRYTPAGDEDTAENKGDDVEKRGFVIKKHVGKPGELVRHWL